MGLGSKAQHKDHTLLEDLTCKPVSSMAEKGTLSSEKTSPAKDVQSLSLHTQQASIQLTAIAGDSII